MEKFLKYLMLMLVATFSLTLTACGGDDDKDEPNPPSPPVIENPENPYGGYTQISGRIIISVGNQDAAQIRPLYDNDSFEFSRRYTYFGSKIAFIGNFKQIKDISDLNGSYEWRAAAYNYIIYKDVKVNDCFLIEITSYGSSYYYIYQFGPYKKNLSGDVIGHYYNLQSYRVN